MKTKIKIIGCLALAAGILSYAVSCLASPVVSFDLNSYLMNSDIVVEGFVKQEFDVPLKTMQAYVSEADVPVRFNFGKGKIVMFEVTRILKGEITRGPLIQIFETPNSLWEKDSSKAGKKYLLFLVPDAAGRGYTVAEGGKGHWRIFDYNGLPKMKAWYQDNSVRAPREYKDYDTLINELEFVLGEEARKD